MASYTITTFDGFQAALLSTSYTGAAMKLALVSAAYTPVLSHSNISQVNLAANETKDSQTNWPDGGFQLLNPVISAVGADGKLTADNILVTPTTIVAARRGVLYLVSTGALIALLDPGIALSSTGTSMRVDWPSGGIIQTRRAA